MPARRRAATLVWRSVHTRLAPLPRKCHSACVLKVGPGGSSTVFLFGGITAGSGEPTNELFRLDLGASAPAHVHGVSRCRSSLTLTWNGSQTRHVAVHVDEGGGAGCATGSPIRAHRHRHFGHTDGHIRRRLRRVVLRRSSHPRCEYVAVVAAQGGSPRPLTLPSSSCVRQSAECGVVLFVGVCPLRQGMVIALPWSARMMVKPRPWCEQQP